MLIYDRDGNECGRIVGRGDLKSTDETLVQTLKEQIASLPHNNDVQWGRSVIACLKAHGYSGEHVE
ncbi:MAG: hypothetical protein WCF90_05620 [Methanomicrobiales archaeon]